MWDVFDDGDNDEGQVQLLRQTHSAGDASCYV
jgi:hypothetical protein